jgi:hypothetical protein
VFDRPHNFGYMQVVAEKYPVTVEFHYRRLDGQWMQFSRDFNDYAPKFLPSGSSYQAIKFTATGTNAIQSIAVAHSLSEFDYV